MPTPEPAATRTTPVTPTSFESVLDVASAAALRFTGECISIPSVSRAEEAFVLELAKMIHARFGWDVELSDAEPRRPNLLVRFGTPRILYTTHTDVVTAPDQLFTPQFTEDRVVGRGACDAKGIIAAMLETAQILTSRGEKDFGLLFVVGEEADAVGAKHAARTLKREGIEYLVNGEPTQGKLISAHNGAVGIKLHFRGVSAHSGYPERGVDAVPSMIDCCVALRSADFGTDPILGPTLINLLPICQNTDGGKVSDHCILKLMARTVGENAGVIAQIGTIAARYGGEVELLYDTPAARLLTLAGFDTDIAHYGTDVPNFAELNVPCLLVGPGDIRVAHSDHEAISQAELRIGIERYVSLHGPLATR